jgi:hypothetical protein
MKQYACKWFDGDQGWRSIIHLQRYDLISTL